MRTRCYVTSCHKTRWLKTRRNIRYLSKFLHRSRVWLFRALQAWGLVELRCARRRSCDWAALACVPGKPTLAVWGGGSVVPLSSGLHGPSECPRDVTSPEQAASRSERAGASGDIPVMQPKVTHCLLCTASPAQRGGRVSQDTRARRPGWLGAVWETGHHGGL